MHVKKWTVNPETLFISSSHFPNENCEIKYVYKQQQIQVNVQYLLLLSYFYSNVLPKQFSFLFEVLQNIYIIICKTRFNKMFQSTK